MHDSHIQLTHQIALHEYKHCVYSKNYLLAMQWSLLWFNTLVHYNWAEDRFINQTLID